MLAGALGQALASLAWSFLSWYLERQSIRDDERRKIALEGLEQINRALDWKANHPLVVDDSDPFSDFVQRNKSDATTPEVDDTGSTRTPGHNKDSNG